jgi:hypothetical protein
VPFFRFFIKMCFLHFWSVLNYSLLSLWSWNLKPGN